MQLGVPLPSRAPGASLLNTQSNSWAKSTKGSKRHTFTGSPFEIAVWVSVDYCFTFLKRGVERRCVCSAQLCPVPVVSAAQVSCGEQHTLAIGESGNVYAWGPRDANRGKGPNGISSSRIYIL